MSGGSEDVTRGMFVIEACDSAKIYKVAMYTVCICCR